MKYHSILFVFTLFFCLLSLSGRPAHDNMLKSSGEHPDELDISPFLKGSEDGVFWTISGYIYKDTDMTVPFPAVSVSFSGLGSVETNQSGYYAYDVPHNWTGTATPAFCSPYFEFSPPQKAYVTVKKNYTQQNYFGTQIQSFIISGVFTHAQSGLPLANTQVNFSNGMSVTTTASGEYSITVPPCWSDTLRPLSTEWNFTPPYIVFDEVSSNLTNQNFDYIEKSFGLPPGWDFVNTGTVHIISVFTTSNPNICGVPLQQGDYIGVFYIGDDGQMHCGGAGEWTGLSNTPIMVNGDDAYTTQKDGFSYGETMNWKVFTWTTTQQEYYAFPTYQTGGYLAADNKWYSGGLSIVNALNAYHTQNIVIPAGWSGISGHFIPRTTNLVSIMRPVVDHLVIMQSMTKMYYPGQNINTIVAWSVNEGYKIKVNQSVVLPFPGCALTNRSQNLLATWSIMPVKSECNVSVQQLFNPVINRIIVVKEIAGNNVFWPAMGINTLQTLIPGKAYMVAVNQTASITFPACTTQKSEISDMNAGFINKSTWPDPVPTSASHILAISGDAISEFSHGDFIGVFTQEGQCAGLAEIPGNGENTGITVYGNDPTAVEKVGFDEGEALTFRVFKASTGEVFNLLVEFDQAMPSTDGTFMDNGLSSITGVHLSSTGNSELYQGSNPRFFPNPSNGMINMIANDEDSFRVTIVDVLGSISFNGVFSGKNQIDLSTLHKGIYMIKFEGTDFINVDKLILK
ncbi:MAG: T9SS type A sorting domain-containing protein [Bacteroidales bacterium]|nr:T9SS type A sorting domain-containing protein [Bacteroidales bacterium]